MTDEMIEEAVAWAIASVVYTYPISYRGTHQRTSCPFCRIQLVEWGNHWRTCKRRLLIARAAIAAHEKSLAKAGFGIRPRVPSKAMLDAGWEAPSETTCSGPLSESMRASWQAMWDAHKPDG